MTGIWKDIAFALRIALRRPALTSACVLTLALAVGANTTVVSGLQAVLLNPLGMRDTAPVMVGRVRIDKLKMPDVTTSGVEYRELLEMTDLFDSVAAAEGRNWTMQIQGEALRLTGQAVTPSFFAVFAESPAIGRFFTPEDRESVVLSHVLWRSQFGADPSVLGRTLILDDKPHRIVGVARETMRFPVKAQAWVPLTLSPSRLQRRGMNMTLTVLVRRRPAVSEKQAAERVHLYVSNLHKSGTAEGKDLAGIGYWLELKPFSRFLAGDLRRPLLLLLIASSILLLAGCANVAVLLLSRTHARAREMAIRLSVGATMGKILRQLMIESITLALIAGLAGVGLASFVPKALAGLSVPGREMLELAKIDYTVLFYSLGIALLTGLLFGLAPAVQLIRENQVAALARHRQRWFQDTFIVVQVASALVLLLGCGVLLRSLWAVQALKPGFDVKNLQTAYLLKPNGDPTFLTRLEPAVAALPGVESAALAYPLPFSGGGLTSGFSIKNRKRSASEPEWHGEAYMVSPRYFETLRIPLLRGRAIQEGDAAAAPLVCVIDAQLAQKFFPGQDPLGQELAMYRGWARIVGVAGAIRGTSLEEGSRPVVYYSLAQVPLFQQVAIVARARQASLRDAVRAVNGSVAVFDGRTMEQRLGSTLGLRRVVATLLGVFATLCLILAFVGLYGVIAQLTGERTREIGVRLALGALPRQILLSFLAHAAWLALLGLGVGLGVAVYAHRWVRSFLYEVKAFDGLTVTVAVGLLILLTLGAAWWPARRASRIDPQQALRVD